MIALFMFVLIKDATLRHLLGGTYVGGLICPWGVSLPPGTNAPSGSHGRLEISPALSKNKPTHGLCQRVEQGAIRLNPPHMRLCASRIRCVVAHTHAFVRFAVG